MVSIHRVVTPLWDPCYAAASGWQVAKLDQVGAGSDSSIAGYGQRIENRWLDDAAATLSRQNRLKSSDQTF
jgi:hypothetical protein